MGPRSHECDNRQTKGTEKQFSAENSQAKLASLRGRGGEKGDDGGRPKPTVPS